MFLQPSVLSSKGNNKRETVSIDLSACMIYYNTTEKVGRGERDHTTSRTRRFSTASHLSSLAGTGQVVVRLVDVNDNSPRLEQGLWQVELNETWGTGPPDDNSLLEISVVDPDTSNYFFYRVSMTLLNGNTAF